jgi:hypothetical protein
LAVRHVGGFPSIADEDAVEEHHLDIEAGRHFDDWLVLLGALDQIFGDHVAGLGDALAKPAWAMSEGESVERWPFTLTVGEVR